MFFFFLLHVLDLIREDLHSTFDFYRAILRNIEKMSILSGVKSFPASKIQDSINNRPVVLKDLVFTDLSCAEKKKKEMAMAKKHAQNCILFLFKLGKTTATKANMFNKACGECLVGSYTRYR